MSRRIASGLALAVLLISGCASTRVAAPANEIADAASSLQVDLSRFQQATRQEQAHKSLVGSASGISRAYFAAQLEQIEVRQAVLDAPSFAAMLGIFQEQATSHLLSLLAPPSPTARPASASMPLGKLSSVATMVRKIAERPKSDDELEFVVGFIKKTNEELAALNEKTK